MGKLSRSVSAASVAVVRAALVTGCTTQADFEALRVEVIAAKAAADRDQPMGTNAPAGTRLSRGTADAEKFTDGLRKAGLAE